MPASTQVAYDALGEARRLLRTIRAVTLSTLLPTNGFPIATLTTISTDHDGSPILLLSQLSLHTRNLDADGRCSLLLSQGGKGDPLAHPRLTLVGTAHKITESQARHRLRARFLAHNPKAALYADFGDFSFWRVAMATAHLNKGFARAADFAASAVLAPQVEGLPDHEEAMLASVTDRQASALAKAAGETGRGWRAVGIDADGLDLAAGDKAARLAFAGPQRTLPDLAAALADIANRAD